MNYYCHLMIEERRRRKKNFQCLIKETKAFCCDQNFVSWQLSASKHIWNKKKSRNRGCMALTFALCLTIDSFMWYAMNIYCSALVDIITNEGHCYTGLISWSSYFIKYPEHHLMFFLPFWKFDQTDMANELVVSERTRPSFDSPLILISEWTVFERFLYSWIDCSVKHGKWLQGQCDLQIMVQRFC